MEKVNVLPGLLTTSMVGHLSFVSLIKERVLTTTMTSFVMITFARMDLNQEHLVMMATQQRLMM
jgi:hypothetical protein